MSTTSQGHALERERPAGPVRHVHLGLGSFFRAHQAWYTDNAPDGAEWPIAAFSGRSAALAERLTTQDGLYTLVTQRPEGNTYDVVGSLARAHAASDVEAWLAYFADPGVGIVTTTVTEAGYCRGADGGIDTERDDVAADLMALRSGDGRPTTAPGRLVAGLAHRRDAGAGPIAVVPCDNLPENGPVLRGVLLGLADAVDPALAAWIEAEVSFVSTMVDRITPETTESDVDGVLAGTGVTDRAPVVTEPFSEWVLAGEFPAGRPDWAAAGALFVDDVAPHETRKLWMLNGAHSTIAYVGSLRGHGNVAEAIADPQVRDAVDAWWSEARQGLDVSAEVVDDYCAALVERFANTAIDHRLAQIGTDGSQKLPVRVLPTLRRERAAGNMPHGAVTALSAWVASCVRGGVACRDARADEIRDAAAGRNPVRDLLTILDPTLLDDAPLVTAVVRRVEELGL
ncbi:fructuronate reductase [Paraoerskovia marina]|uniref:Mannitol-1-phosphate 5-dehydrogenase n=1 Tax=Paraoerskovia marina TaxID=545619 RepID=A0A1H1MCC2_9CELL|nr:mannitol dehydrogenase family protein [Paraoerskovia marina]SDR84300.1 fructuronate reductase [Paraoerskovia marina]